jgi:hypothetical protein
VSTNRVRPYGPVVTTLTTDQIDRLYDAVNKLRDGTTTVKVDADDLRALLKDHAVICTLVTTNN